MNSKSNIVLIGMPACGKSTIGVQLAKWLSMGFIDTDLLVQARAGESMQAYQNGHGMEAYQTLECDTVKSVVCENCVIATGGSAIYCPGAMSHLRQIAKVVFIDVPIEEITQRIGDISRRGVVIQTGMTLDDLYIERHPFYLKYADIVIDCAGRSQDEVLQEVQTVL